MAKMKREFKLEVAAQHGKGAGNSIVDSNSYITIVGDSPECDSYVSISCTSNGLFFIKDKDLERFAVNILKAIKSKKLKK